MACSMDGCNDNDDIANIFSDKYMELYNFVPYDASEMTQEFTNIFSSNYCFPFINKPTRVTYHSASLIDNIYSNIPPHNCSTGILKCSISDHYGIFCIDNYCKISNNETQISKRSFCNKNIARFKNCLRNESWDFVYLSNDIQSAYSRFQGVLDQHLNTSFKRQTFTMNYNDRRTSISN